MPALWQSSQRPMYVRTVWVNGFRHAILSHDDPHYIKIKRRRPHSSASCVKPQERISRLSNHSDLDGCLKNFNYIITNNKSIKKQRPKTSHEINVERLNLVEVEQESEDLALKTSPLDDNNTESPNRDSKFIMKNIRLNKTARADVKENTELSDRVLQWLDLAGKVDLLAPDNGERMSQPRHSCPELQKRNFNLSKSKTTADMRGRIQSPKVFDSPKAQQTGIDRHDFHVPSTANTIENYARQSRHVRITPGSEMKMKDNAKKPKDLKANVIETRRKMVNERNAVEKQYAEMMSKKLIPDVSKNVKRQVHIFIPEIVKKQVSNTTSRTESLLSQPSNKV